MTMRSAQCYQQAQHDLHICLQLVPVLHALHAHTGFLRAATQCCCCNVGLSCCRMPCRRNRSCSDQFSAVGANMWLPHQSTLLSLRRLAPLLLQPWRTATVAVGAHGWCSLLFAVAVAPVCRLVYRFSACARLHRGARHVAVQLPAVDSGWPAADSSGV